MDRAPARAVPAFVPPSIRPVKQAITMTGAYRCAAAPDLSIMETDEADRRVCREVPLEAGDGVSNLEIYLPARDRVELRGYDDLPLGSGEVRGRTLASVDSPGSVLAVLGGAMPEALPAHPGHAAVFEVDEVGAEVNGIARGDRLFCQGADRSTQQYIPHLTVPVPPGMDPVAAVLARLMGVSMTTLMTTAARSGDLVAVTGLGPVGYLAAHLFRLANYEVIAADPDLRRRRWAAGSGISRVFERLPVEHPDVAGRVDLVVECSGNEAAVADACKVLATGAEVVLIGTPWARKTKVYAHEILKAVFYRLVTLRSGWEFEIPLRRIPFAHGGHDRDYNNARHTVFSGYRKALAWLAAGRIPLAGMVRTVSPRDATAVYRSLQRQEFKELFLVWDWTAQDCSTLIP